MIIKMIIELLLYIVASYLFMGLMITIYANDAVQIGGEAGFLGLLFIFAPLGALIILYGIIRQLIEDFIIHFKKYY